MKQMSEIYPLLTHEPDRGHTRKPAPHEMQCWNHLWLTSPAGDEWANIRMSVGNLGDLSELTWRLHILSALHFTRQLNVFEPVKPRHFFESLRIRTSVSLTRSLPVVLTFPLFLYVSSLSVLTLRDTLRGRCVRSAACVSLMCCTVR